MSDLKHGQEALLSPEKQVQKERKPRKAGELKPCERCKAQHLKCVYPPNSGKCQRCERSGHDCIRSTKKIRFRDVPVSKFRNARRNATNTTEKSKSTILKFANETVSSASGQYIDKKDHHTAHSTTDNCNVVGQDSFATLHEVEDGLQYNGSNESASEAQSAKGFVENKMVGVNGSEPLPKRNANDEQHQNLDSGHQTEAASSSNASIPLDLERDQLNLESVFSSDRLSTISFSSSPRKWMSKAAPANFLDDMVKAPSVNAVSTSETYLETILLRYFHEELAPWFDQCDPDRHFANILPQRARRPGPLRSALLTISARNLSRNQNFRSDSGIVQWQGRLLPELKEEFAMPYHNDCIRDLLQLSLDPKRLHDETLLAAVVALRTDEEMGLYMQDDEEDQQLFLRIASLFVDAQLPLYLALPHSSPQVFHPSFEDDAVQSNTTSPSGLLDHEPASSGLRQACFWTAFRQDLHAAFLKQQPVRFPLSRCEAFRQISPATDAVWANRMVTFCADVLEFCYGSDSVDAKIAPAYTNQERWHELRSREASLCALLPASFEPIYCCEPDAAHGSVFPTLFFLESYHVSGTTYVELARMLLEVYNPTRPKLGRGFLAATNAFISSTKKILFRLCGIALSNHHCPPSLINACLGISMFGEYYEDPIEQEALLSVLAFMSNRYAYPTSQISNALRRAWYLCEEGSTTSISHIDLG